MKTILLTGATDGIGLETAKRLLEQGHKLLLHGRNPQKLAALRAEFTNAHGEDRVETCVADLSDLKAVAAMADTILAAHDRVDVLVNNAGVFKTPDPVTPGGLDVRFVVNTLAPMLLSRRLAPIIAPGGRIVNLSSAAQASVDFDALQGHKKLADNAAYAQSKLALTMWSNQYADEVSVEGIMVVAVNPGSLLATKMVKEGYGIPGSDIGIGAGILVRAALSDEFADASGKYFDNDSGRFADPHPDAMDADQRRQLVDVLDTLLAREG
ncbi:SDR family NAD(P)-dependent oxidoreductase [Henriciella marina]|uniref:SDR family NAD(P)-dependent oxidoreductase n=1 Tax=Henriciella marina TaxID=453851 RepID=A0ABT4LYF7_9PROT|nr:SDR family NAD(P)-dependent oxidoreductase [Henriciella marina]MCZ4299419.1 SDR family NAD(P)-dependent oxidoreductase [Henriciella marina]